MNVKARTPKGGKGPSERADRLNLRATSPRDEVWFAALYVVLMGGGRLTIAPDGREPVELEFGSPWVRRKLFPAAPAGVAKEPPDA